MRLSDPKRIAILVTVCCVFTVVTVISPVQAADRSRVVTVALFASGLGLQLGSTFAQSSAQDSYDQYLDTALQVEITQHRDDYISKSDASVLMSRVGIGFIGLATLISIFDQLDMISGPPAELATRQITPSYNRQTHETALLFRHRF